LALASPKNSISTKSPRHSNVALTNAKGISPRELITLPKRNWSFNDVRLAIAAEVATDKVIAPIPTIIDSDNSNTLPNEN